MWVHERVSQGRERYWNKKRSDYVSDRLLTDSPIPNPNFFIPTATCKKKTKSAIFSYRGQYSLANERVTFFTQGLGDCDEKLRTHHRSRWSDLRNDQWRDHLGFGAAERSLRRHRHRRLKPPTVQDTVVLHRWCTSTVPLTQQPATCVHAGGFLIL